MYFHLIYYLQSGFKKNQARGRTFKVHLFMQVKVIKFAIHHYACLENPTAFKNICIHLNLQFRLQIRSCVCSVEANRKSHTVVFTACLVRKGLIAPEPAAWGEFVGTGCR